MTRQIEVLGIVLLRSVQSTCVNSVRRAYANISDRRPLGPHPLVHLMTAFLNVCQRYDVIAFEAGTCFVSADLHRAFFRQSNPLDHVSNSGSPKIVEKKIRNASAFHGRSPGFIVRLDFSAGRISACTLSQRERRTNFAICRYQKKTDSFSGKCSSRNAFCLHSHSSMSP